MSAHGHATPGDAAASHDHHYEGIAADRPGPDEPQTPLWLPLVGIGLFLLSLLTYLMTRPPAKTGAELAKDAAPAAVVSAAPSAAAPAPAGSAPNARVRRFPFPQPGADAPAGAAPAGAAPAGAAPAGAAPAPRPMPRMRTAPGAPAAPPPAPPPAPAQ